MPPSRPLRGLWEADGAPGQNSAEGERVVEQHQQYQLTEALPESLKGKLPTIEEIEAELENDSW